MLVFSKLHNKNLEKTNNQNGNSLSLEVLPTHPSLTKCISVGYLPLHRGVPRCPVIRELKHATFLSHGRQPEVNILQARTNVSPRFSK